MLQASSIISILRATSASATLLLQAARRVTVAEGCKRPLAAVQGEHRQHQPLWPCCKGCPGRASSASAAWPLLQAANVPIAGPARASIISISHSGPCKCALAALPRVSIISISRSGPCCKLLTCACGTAQGEHHQHQPLWPLQMRTCSTAQGEHHQHQPLWPLLQAANVRLRDRPGRASSASATLALANAHLQHCPERASSASGALALAASCKRALAGPPMGSIISISRFGRCCKL